MKEPASLTVAAGATAVLEVEAINSTGYQWYKVGTGALSDTGKYSGTATSTLTITNVQLAEEGDYECVATGPTGSDTSESALLMTERLVGLWKFEGDLTDTVTTEVTGAPVHDGIYVGGSEAYDASGISGQALSFLDDPNHLVISGDATDFNFYPQGFTASAWIKTTANLDWQSVFSKNPGATSGFSMSVEPALSNRFSAALFGNPIASVGSATENISDDQWHMATMTYDPNVGSGIGSLEFYVDGLSEGSTAVSGTYPTGPESLVLGTSLDGTSPLIGSMDDVRVYSYSLNDIDVAQLYMDTTGLPVCYTDPGPADISGDCIVNIVDIALMAAQWLEDGNSYPSP
jgi:hypothetical protein